MDESLMAVKQPFCEENREGLKEADNNKSMFSIQHSAIITTVLIGLDFFS